MMNIPKFGAKFSVSGTSGVFSTVRDDIQQLLTQTAQQKNVPIAFQWGSNGFTERLCVFTGPDADAFTIAEKDYEDRFYPAANPKKAAVHAFNVTFMKPASETVKDHAQDFETVHQNYKLVSGAPKFDLLTLAPSADV
jgi:hypothetical protein